MLRLTYEYKLTPTPEQTECDDWLYLCSSVWKFVLSQRQDGAKARKCDINACSGKQEYMIPVEVKRPTDASQCQALTVAKKEYPHLTIPQSQVRQQVLKTLETAFVCMWERGCGCPRFKKPGRMRRFVFPQLKSSDWKGEDINLPKIGVVKMLLCRPILQGFDLKQVAANSAAGSRRQSWQQDCQTSLWIFRHAVIAV